MNAMRTFNVFDAEFEYDESDPEGYRSGMHRFGPKVGGKRLGATLYEIPPGQSICPYHYETEEEWLMVLDGQPVIRTPEGEIELRRGDVIAFAPGPEGAHKATNRGDQPARVMMWSNRDAIGSCVYPDSNKISFWNEHAEPTETVRVKRGTSLDYWLDEPGL
jgi:uncharacterized cupin superfamily protein